jgi:hypothetical protein
METIPDLKISDMYAPSKRLSARTAEVKALTSTTGDQLEIAPRNRTGSEGIGKSEYGRHQTDGKGQHETHGSYLKGNPESLEKRPRHKLVVFKSKNISLDPIPLPVISESLGTDGKDPDDYSRKEEKFGNIEQDRIVDVFSVV